MQLSYQLTQRDFYESLIAHRNRRTFTKWLVRLLVAVVIAANIGGLVVLARRWDARLLTTVLPLFLLLILWVWFLWISVWWAARNLSLKQPAAQGTRTVLFDSTGVHHRWNGGSSNVEWKTYVRCVEAKNLIMLYTSPLTWTIIPKRALDTAQLSELRRLVVQNIGVK
jgi:hypothetical protein